MRAGIATSWHTKPIGSKLRPCRQPDEHDTQTAGWDAGILNSNGDKPKDMHWETYDRLKRDHDELKQVSFYDIGRKLGFLHKLEGR